MRHWIRTGSDYGAIDIDLGTGPDFVAATSARSARMHLASRSGPIGTFGGSCSMQRASAKPQRGAKEQLAGALSSEGGVPGMVSSRWPRLAPWTVEASKPLRIGMDRRAHDLAERALLDDLAGIHHRDAVADFDGDADIVGDEDDRHAELALQFAQQQQDLDLHGGIERRGRLVREQDFRLAGQRQRDHRALPHAAGHLMRIGVEPAFGGGNAHHFQHFQRARHRLAAWLLPSWRITVSAICWPMV